MNRYIDASVLISYYLPEPLSVRAEHYLRRGGIPAISPLVEIEFASVRRGRVYQNAHAISTLCNGSRTHSAVGL